jgi:hypothetical protein
MGQHQEALSLLRENDTNLVDGSVPLFTMLLHAVVIKHAESSSSLSSKKKDDEVDLLELARQDWDDDDQDDGGGGVAAGGGADDTRIEERSGNSWNALCDRLFASFERMSDEDKATSLADSFGEFPTAKDTTNGQVFSRMLCAWVQEAQKALPKSSSPQYAPVYIYTYMIFLSFLPVYILSFLLLPVY